MAKTKHMKIYLVSQHTKLGIWFRRNILGHYVVTGKQLKPMLPKNFKNKYLIKNRVLYGVKVTIK